METPGKPVKRPRMEEGSAVDAAPSAEGPANDTIVTGRKYRRLVIPDSDDDDDDVEDELGVPRGTGDGKSMASFEAPQTPLPTPLTSKSSPSSDGEIDAILDIELDVDGDDEVGDDEEDIHPSPEGDDVVDIPERAVVHTAVPQPTPVIDGKFANTLRSVINLLIEWAQAQDFRADRGTQPAEARAMTFGFWSVLRRLSVDHILNVFMRAIPLEVQALFEKDAWSVEDFLRLPYAQDDECQGVYGNFAMGAIAHQREIGCDAYVGSTRCLKKRISDHLGMAERYSVAELPEKVRRSFHYRQICRDEVHSEFRLLASFDPSIESGYLLLLEGIFMILLGTYKHPGYTSVYATQASYDLTESIREHLNLPKIDWRGMNAAWPLRQGFYNRIARTENACWNSACDRMTYPPSKRPDGAPIYHRRSGNPGDPLGGYLCGICARYRDWHNVLPNASALARFAQRIEARENAGADAACGTCGRLESQLPEKPFTWPNGDVTFYNRKHRVHPGLPRKLLCEPCYHFFGLNQREKTDEEVEHFLTSFFLVAARREGGNIRCENPNCGAIQGSKDCGKKNHIANRRTRKVLCQACDGYERLNPGTLRCEAQVAAYSLGLRVKEDRSAKKPIVCQNSNCNALEVAGQKKLFQVSKDANMLLCPPCNNYFLKTNGQHRSAKTVQLSLKQAQVAEDRKAGKPIVCGYCFQVEPNGARSKHVVNSDDMTVWCANCQRKTYRERRKRAEAERAAQSASESV